MILSHYNYWISIILMMIGFYGVIAKKNLIKQAIALGLFQTGVFLFYVSIGVKEGGGAPVWELYVDPSGKQHEDIKHLEMGPSEIGPSAVTPLNHVLILTAIVVSVSTLAVAMALVIGIKRSYGTIEEDEIAALDAATAERKA